MDFVVPRGVLKTVLDKISVSCDGLSKIPPFLKIEGTGDTLHLTTSNNFLTIRIVIGDIEPHNPFLIGVDGRRLREIVHALSEGVLSFFVSERSCRIQGGGSSFKLPIFTPETAPGLFAPTDRVSFDLPYQPLRFDRFFSAVAKVFHCTSEKDGVRPYARGVILTGDSVHGTDGFRLATHPNDFIFVEDSILIPAKALKNLTRVFGGLAEEGSVHIEKGRIVLVNSGVSVSLRLLTDKVPRISSAIPRDTPLQSRSVVRDSLILALKRALIVAREQSPVASYFFEGDQLFIRTENEGNESEEVLPTSPHPEAFELKCNIRFILEAAQAIKDDMVAFEFRGKDEPLLLVDSNRVHLNVLMPVSDPNG